MRLACVILLACSVQAADLRIGIIGADTSHATAFTKLLNVDNIGEGAKVVAAVKGGSPDVEASRSRIERFTTELQSKYNVEIVPDIKTLLTKVDAVLLLGVDGRVHLAQAREVFVSKKPVFIDKPLAASLADAREIARAAREAGAPWFSSSSLRFGKIAESLRTPDNRGAMVWGPGPTEEHHSLQLTWYGIHSVELLYTLMGPGCESVSMHVEQGSDVLVGKWSDGRLGTIRLQRPYGPFGAVVFTDKEAKQSQATDDVGYAPLITKVVEFFRTRRAPVTEAETMEIFEFMDAAQRSKAQGGAPAQRVLRTTTPAANAASIKP